MIWLIKDITAGAYLTFVSSMNVYYLAAATNLIVIGVYMWPIYGIALGYLYKK